MEETLPGDRYRVPELVREYAQLRQAAQRLQQLLPAKLAALVKEYRCQGSVGRATRKALQDQRYLSDVQKFLSVSQGAAEVRVKLDILRMGS